MSVERFLLDTVYIQALLNRDDDYHQHAQSLLPRVRGAAEVWVTEAVLTEVGNALGKFNRQAAVEFINQCYRTPNIHVVTVSEVLFRQAIDLYEARGDKEWGLTDCISFVVMEQEGLEDAVTADKHFAQAGFRPLL